MARRLVYAFGTFDWTRPNGSCSAAIDPSLLLPRPWRPCSRWSSVTGAWSRRRNYSASSGRTPSWKRTTWRSTSRRCAGRWATATAPARSSRRCPGVAIVSPAGWSGGIETATVPRRTPPTLTPPSAHGRAGRGDADNRLRPSPRRASAWAALAGLAVLVVSVGWWQRLRRAHPRPPNADRPGQTGITRVAVLPFVNLGSQGDEAFVAGLTEEVASRLAGLSRLAVPSTTTVAGYDRRGKSLGQLGADLGVDYVIEGSVRWAQAAGAPRIRITPKLIRAADDTVVWTEQYDASLSDLIAVQAEIAQRIAGALEVALDARERRAVAARPTVRWRGIPGLHPRARVVSARVVRHREPGAGAARRWSRRSRAIRGLRSPGAGWRVSTPRSTEPARSVQPRPCRRRTAPRRRPSISSPDCRRRTWAWRSCWRATVSSNGRGRNSTSPASVCRTRRNCGRRSRSSTSGTDAGATPWPPTCARSSSTLRRPLT